MLNNNVITRVSIVTQRAVLMIEEHLKINVIFHKNFDQYWTEIMKKLSV